MKNLKLRLKLLLRDAQINQEELYNKTGYYFESVKTKEDFNEIVRLLSELVYNLDKWYID